MNERIDKLRAFLDGAHSFFHTTALLAAELDNAGYTRLIESAGVIGSSKLMIDDTPGISVSEMRSKCRKYKLEHGLDVIFIDYLQMMSVTSKRQLFSYFSMTLPVK